MNNRVVELKMRDSHQRLIAKTVDRTLSSIFILCETCHWCATYVDKTRIPIGNTCPQCQNADEELSSLSILSSESFTFDYDNKRGVTLGFKKKQML
jgi:predicted Zn-ribbon and HTH transcriptional regulator